MDIESVWHDCFHIKRLNDASSMFSVALHFCDKEKRMLSEQPVEHP